MIEIIKNDKVLQMLIIAFMACVAYWVFIIRVPRRKFKETNRVIKDNQVFIDQAQAIYANYISGKKDRNIIKVKRQKAFNRKSSVQSRRIRMNRGRRS